MGLPWERRHRLLDVRLGERLGEDRVRVVVHAERVAVAALELLSEHLLDALCQGCLEGIDALRGALLLVGCATEEPFREGARVVLQGVGDGALFIRRSVVGLEARAQLIGPPLGCDRCLLADCLLLAHDVSSGIVEYRPMGLCIRTMLPSSSQIGGTVKSSSLCRCSHSSLLLCLRPQYLHHVAVRVCLRGPGRSAWTSLVHQGMRGFV